MKAEVEYTALVTVRVDLETGEVASVGINATRDTDETPSEVSVSVESETDQPDEVFDHLGIERPGRAIGSVGHGGDPGRAGWRNLMNRQGSSRKRTTKTRRHEGITKKTSRVPMLLCVSFVSL